MIRARLRRKWLRFAVSGLILNGFGLSLLGEAIISKSSGQGPQWILLGTIALVCINAGISLVGTAVKYQVHLDNADKYHNSKKKVRNSDNPE